jgi:hypothetical protein
MILKKKEQHDRHHHCSPVRHWKEKEIRRRRRVPDKSRERERKGKDQTRVERLPSSSPEGGGNGLIVGVGVVGVREPEVQLE